MKIKALVIAWLGVSLPSISAPSAESDPFAAPDAVPADPNDEKEVPQPPTNARIICEIFRMTQAQAAEILHLAGKDQDRYLKVCQWLDAGKVVCEDFEIITKYDGRAKLESEIEFPYPSEFKAPPAPEALPIPSHWINRRLGFSWEIDVTVDGRQVDLHASLTRTRFEGWQEIKKNVLPIAQPMFEHRSVSPNATLPIGKPRLIGTISGKGSDDAGSKKSSARLLFLRAETREIRPTQPLRKAPPDSAQIYVSIYSMSLTDARQCVESSRGDDDRLLQTLKDWTKRGRCRLERVSAARAKMDSRSWIREQMKGFEAIVGDGVHRIPQEILGQLPFEWNLALGGWSADHRPILPTPVQFEHQSSGLEVEVHPAMDESASCLAVNLQAKLQHDAGAISGSQIVESYAPRRMTSIQEMSTSIASSFHGNTLVGTFSPPHSTGVMAKEGPRRVWLLFLSCTSLPE